MKCSDCGTENTEGAAYCENCGASLEAPRDAGAARPVPLAGAPSGNPEQANDTVPLTPVASASPAAGSATASRMGGMGSMNAAMPSEAQIAQLRQVGSRLGPIAVPLQQPLAPLEAVGPRMLAWIGSALLVLGFLIFPVFSFGFSIGAYSTSGSYRMWTYSHGQWLLYLLLTLARRQGRCYALTAGLVCSLVAMGLATALASPLASAGHHAGSSAAPPAAQSLARRLGITSHPFAGSQPAGIPRGWTAWFPRAVKPGWLGPGNVPSRHLALIGPALFAGPQGARGEFHYYNPGSVEQHADRYRGAALTRARGIHLAYAWLRAIGAPIPHGSPYLQLRSGMTVIGGTGLCCYRSLAVLSWNGKQDSFGNVWSAADMIYVADAGTVVEADIGPLMTSSGYGFSHPCAGQTHRDTTGIVVGPWCFAYPSAVRTMIIGDIGGHSSWIDNPAYLAEIDAASLNRQGYNPKLSGPRRQLIFSPQRAVYLQAYKGVPYRMTFVPAFPGLIGSIWELVRVQRAG